MIYMGGNVPLTITITDALSPYSNHSASGGASCVQRCMGASQLAPAISRAQPLARMTPLLCLRYSSGQPWQPRTRPSIIAISVQMCQFTTTVHHRMLKRCGFVTFWSTMIPSFL